MHGGCSKNTPASCTDTEIERGYRRRNRITSEEIVPNLGGDVKKLHGGMLCMAEAEPLKAPTLLP